MRFSVIVPALEEESGIAATVSSTALGLAAGDELIVVDGGSRDATVQQAKDAGATVLGGLRGRGRQMNLGAAAASGDVLLFLHADTRLPAGFRGELERVLADPDVGWGRFDVALDDEGALLRVVGRLISWRSRWMRSATGDQAIFVRAEVFEAIGGYREPRLFEDVDLARRLRAFGRMGIPRGTVVTSARRWRNRGTIRTTLRMWILKSLYLMGFPAEKLVRLYDDER